MYMYMYIYIYIYREREREREREKHIIDLNHKYFYSFQKLYQCEINYKQKYR